MLRSSPTSSYPFRQCHEVSKVSSKNTSVLQDLFQISHKLQACCGTHYQRSLLPVDYIILYIQVNWALEESSIHSRLTVTDRLTENINSLRVCVVNICQLIPRDPDQAGPGSAVRFLDRGHRDLLLTHQGCFSDTQWASAIWNLIMDIMAKLDQNITPCWIGRRWCAMLCHAWTCAGWLTVLLQTNHGVLCHLCVSEKRSYQRADLFLDVRVDSEEKGRSCRRLSLKVIETEPPLVAKSDPKNRTADVTDANNPLLSSQKLLSKSAKV